MLEVLVGLNPLGIGEGFEPIHFKKSKVSGSLNPLGIGEGFEQLLPV